MDILGLHHLIQKCADTAADLKDRAAKANDPREQNRLSMEALQVAEQADKFRDQLTGDERMLESIMSLCNYLAESPHKGNTRTEVLAHLKASAGLLIMEIGHPVR